MLFVNVTSLDEIVTIVQKLRVSIVRRKDRRAYDRLGDNPVRSSKNIFGV